MNIREEQPEDIKQIWAINAEAFETQAEAKLVDDLRESGCTFISLVAEEQGKLLGHILFTSVDLDGSENKLKLMGLAPMAVGKQYQGKGIGSKLVEAGINLLRSKGYDAVFVLGHPDYYPRFGFAPSVKFGITSEYDAPQEAFLALELVPGVLDGNNGVIRFHDAFAGV